MPVCRACLPSGPPFLVAAPVIAVMAGGVYDGGLRRAVLAYKEHSRRELTRPLAALLAHAVIALLAHVVPAPPGEAVLVPVPSDRTSARRRGGDHVLRLARLAASRLDTTAAAALGFARPVRDSAGLARQARRANLSGAFVADAAMPGRAAVIVDDIVTTGVTLTEAGRALRAAGWPVVGAATLAATPLRAPPPRQR